MKYNLYLKIKNIFSEQIKLFNKNRKEINIENYNMLFGLNIISIIISIVFYIYTIKTYGFSYSTPVFALLLSLTFILQIFFVKKESNSIVILFYAYELICFCFGLYISRLPNAINEKSMTCLFLLLIIPLSQLDISIRKLPMLILFNTIFILVELAYKPYAIFVYDTIYALVLMVITTYLSHYFISLRLQEKFSKNNYKYLSTYDELTNLPNRRKLNKIMDECDKVFNIENKDFACLIMDIDNFKVYNDTYGHLEGDNCLEKIANVCSKISQKYNISITRYGGEEFVAIVSDCDYETIKKIATDLVDSVHKLEITSRNIESKKITCSVGFASKIANKATNVTDLLDKADEGLYLAKKCGKNQACSID